MSRGRGWYAGDFGFYLRWFLERGYVPGEGDLELPGGGLDVSCAPPLAERLLELAAELGPVPTETGGAAQYFYDSWAG